MDKKEKMIDKKKGKRLSKEEWQEIKLLLLKPDRNISQIAKNYKISRHTVYEYSWRKGWLERKPMKPEQEPKRSFWAILWESLVGKPHISHANAIKKKK